ncbi:MAG: ribosomal-processing cysteine protease Prp [Bacilli bacterium]|nr:ribosomal-processing cysteine protease Prp [Bacilli bacterium]
MTKVVIRKKNDLIKDIEIKGHAFSGPYNQDIVCAGISSIVFGTCNALAELSNYDEEQIIFKDALIKIPNISEDKETQLICQVMIVQLKTIEQSYPQYIEIAYI